MPHWATRIETLAETLRESRLGHRGDLVQSAREPESPGSIRASAEFIGYHGSAKARAGRPSDDARGVEAGSSRSSDIAILPVSAADETFTARIVFPKTPRTLLLGRAPVGRVRILRPADEAADESGARLERRDGRHRERSSPACTEKYDTAIRHTAEELALFFARLDEAGLFDDALVVLTADHGEELFDHGGFAHRYSLHREILHVPLFVKLPGQHAGDSVAEPVSLTDVHGDAARPARAGPTCSGPRGRTLADSVPRAGRACAERAPRPRLRRARDEPKRCVGRAVRKGQFALLEIERSYQHDVPRTELYDLAHDPREQHDLHATKPHLRAALRLALAERYEATARDGFTAVDYPLSASERAALEALGYADAADDPADRQRDDRH